MKTKLYMVSYWDIKYNKNIPIKEIDATETDKTYTFTDEYIYKTVVRKATMSVGNSYFFINSNLAILFIRKELLNLIASCVRDIKIANDNKERYKNILKELEVK